jgi:hypothetical protein
MPRAKQTRAMAGVCASARFVQAVAGPIAGPVAGRNRYRGFTVVLRRSSITFTRSSAEGAALW